MKNRRARVLTLLMVTAFVFTSLFTATRRATISQRLAPRDASAGGSPTATPTPAAANPAAAIPGTYTAVAAYGTAVTIGTGIPQPAAPHRLEIQNNCAAVVTIQFGGATAAYGYGYEIAATSTKVWNSDDGTIPKGPYSLITAPGGICDPAVSATGLTIYEAQ